MQEEFTTDGMAATASVPAKEGMNAASPASVDIPKMNDRMNSGEEGSIQPPSSLRDQLGNSVRNVCDGPRRLDVVEKLRVA